MKSFLNVILSLMIICSFVVFNTTAKAAIPASLSNIEEYAVSEIYEMQFTINAESNNISYGVVFGGGTFDSGTSVTLTAVPLTGGYSFVRWLENGIEVSKNYLYTFTVTKNATFVAEFIAPTPISINYTKTDIALYGDASGSISISASGGDSGVYNYSITNGMTWQNDGTFSGLSAGAYMIAVCDAHNDFNVTKTLVTIEQPIYVGSVPTNKIASTANAGTAVTLVPSAPKGYTLQSTSYSSSNPAVATVDAYGNISFVSGGKTTIIMRTVSQTVDKRGRVKTKTTTVKKNITVNQPIQTIALNLTDTTITRSQKVKFTPAFAPATASNKKVKWTSSNKKVATVSSSGVVTGKTGGTAVITCVARDGSGAATSCSVTVTPIYPTGLKLSKTRLTMRSGKTAQLKASVLPKATDFKTVVWVSSAPEIISVDAKGKIKALAPGTATVTATTSNGLSISCTVIVN